MIKASSTSKPTQEKFRIKSIPSTIGNLLNHARKATLTHYERVKASTIAFMRRRPHRSFRRTYRRDYARSLQSPGYIAFTVQVGKTLMKRRRLFIGLIALYAFMMVVLGGITGQDTYDQIAELVQESSTEIFEGSWGKVGQAGLLLVSAFAGGSGTMEADQQVYLGVIFLLTWLTTVWLLREILAGRKPKLRDGLYNAAAPFVSTLLVVVAGVLQLIPLAIMAVIYSGLSGLGVITEGFGSMLFYVLTGFVALLCLYWLTSTFVAMIVVTLPGIYPMRALRTAGDLVVGRRKRILLRVLWSILVALIAWIIVVLPAVMFDSWIKGVWDVLGPIPFVPAIVAFMSAASTVWFAAYIYLFYRKIVDDDAKPA